MPDVAKLKKKAAEFELKKQFDKALAVYVEILDSYEASRRGGRRLPVQPGRRPLPQAGQRRRRRRLLRAGGRPLRRRRVLQQRDRALQQDPAQLAGPRARSTTSSARSARRRDSRATRSRTSSSTPTACRSRGKIDEAFRALKEFADLCPGPGRHPPDARRPAVEEGPRRRGHRAAAAAVRALHRRRAATARPTPPSSA